MVHVVINVDASANVEVREASVVDVADVGDVLDVVACVEYCQEIEVKNVEFELSVTLASMDAVKRTVEVQLQMVELLNEQGY